MKGFALVNYPDSDETDEDYIKDSPPTPHWEDVQMKMRNGNIEVCLRYSTLKCCCNVFINRL